MDDDLAWQPPLWRRVLAQFQDPLVYLLLGAVVTQLAIGRRESRRAEVEAP